MYLFSKLNYILILVINTKNNCHNDEKAVQNHIIKKAERERTQKGTQYEFEGKSNALNRKQEILHTLMHQGNVIDISVFLLMAFCNSQK